jgi:ActR/RegA family two-component response regulator
MAINTYAFTNRHKSFILRPETAMPNKMVLLVEDDPIYAGFIQSAIALTGLPVNVFHASTVDAALAYVRTLR